VSAVAAQPQGDLRKYAIVTGAYWADTIADGAIRLLILFYFDQLGYSPFALASLFLFYEIFGIVTNLVGGWLAARLGLRATLLGGLGTQILALTMLLVAPKSLLVVPYVMVAQALSGIAKDLTKMSSKSAVKLVVPEDAPAALFRWVAILTGSKNALKGVGFFVGGLLLTVIGFRSALGVLLLLEVAAVVGVVALMRGTLGHVDRKAKFAHMFSNNRSVNVLAAARVLLFASRDVWFTVGLPVFLWTKLGWSFWQVGGFLAIWVIGYGIVQALVPGFLRSGRHAEPSGSTAVWLAFLLASFPAAIAVALMAGGDPTIALVVGLIAFGIVFAMNSSVHSFLILSYSDNKKVAMNVGFYYMANAGGRLAGLLLSGLLYQWRGLDACLWAAVAFVLGAGAISLLLPKTAADARAAERVELPAAPAEQLRV
jgi:predicted MFS family arabinose efflux permease